MKLTFVTSAMTLAMLIAHPASAVITSSDMTDHQWTRQAHVEVVTGSTGGTKSHARTK